MAMNILIAACEVGDVEFFNAIVRDNGINDVSELRDSTGNTLLHYAAESGSPALTVTLCDDYDFDVNARNLQLTSPLHNACQHRDSHYHEAVALCLIRRGADIMASDANGATPFDIAPDRLKQHFHTLKGKHLTFKSLAGGMHSKERVSRRFRSPYDPEVEFLEACKFGRIEVARRLIEEGVDPDAANIESSSALYIACEFGQTEIVKLLVESGADVNRVEEYRNTPLLISSSLGYIDIIQVLGGDHRLNFAQRGLFGRTAATVSAENGHTEVVRFLVLNCMELVNMQDGDGYTPLHYSALTGNIELSIFLVEQCNADLSIQNTIGKRACELSIGMLREYLCRRGDDGSEGEMITWEKLVSGDEHGNRKKKDPDMSMDIMMSMNTTGSKQKRTPKPKRLRLKSPNSSQSNTKMDDFEVSASSSTPLSTFDADADIDMDMDVDIDIDDDYDDFEDDDGDGDDEMSWLKLQHPRLRSVLGNDMNITVGASESSSANSYQAKAKTTEIERSRLKIGSMIARGTSGDIQGALLRTDDSDKLVVVKKARGIRPSRFTMEMMANEVVHAAHLKHANIAPLIGTVLEYDFECLVYELAAYGSLSRALSSTVARRVLMSHNHALIWKIAIDVAQGLAFAHQNGVVHRDLRSANVVLTPDPFTAQVSDFGMAGTIREDTKHLEPPRPGIRTVSTEAGALTSLAPEAYLRQEACDEKMDVFSYALLIVEIFYLGRAVYGHSDPSTVAREVAWRGLRPNLPESLAVLPWWRALVEKCWEHDPAKRPSFNEIVQELERQRPTESDLIQSYVDFHTTGLDMRDEMWRSLLGLEAETSPVAPTASLDPISLSIPVPVAQLPQTGDVKIYGGGEGGDAVVQAEPVISIIVTKPDDS